ncbi:hypothetical protein LPN01_07350 [Sphingomonas sp. A2-49]|uniref:hypothetical protein n=1 Tax=Sphingomonas sp. A2-49 TaxID=1391375 RepID=UPI0021D31712|nr:hypothetical protein [Sphingomonas sp. A2-49]MCU6453889.1 hypothetical protein [Sphingomonas sp. A2-49]
MNAFEINAWGRSCRVPGFGNTVRQWSDRAGSRLCGRTGGANRSPDASPEPQRHGSGGWKGDAEVAICVACAKQEQLADYTMARIVDCYSDKSET